MTTMRRTDLALLTAGLIAYAGLLLAASWRPTPDRHDTVLILYIIGFALEILGALAVGYDLWARRRRARNYNAEARKVDLRAKLDFDTGWSAEAATTGGDPLTVDERLRILEEWQRGEGDRVLAVITPVRKALEAKTQQAEHTVDESSRKREGQIVALIGPSESTWIAWAGFAALILGIAAGFAGNIVSATS